MDSLLPELACLLVEQMGSVWEVERLVQVNQWFWKMRRRLLLHFMASKRYSCDICPLPLVPLKDASATPVLIEINGPSIEQWHPVSLRRNYAFCSIDCIDVFNLLAIAPIPQRRPSFHLGAGKVVYRHTSDPSEMAGRAHIDWVSAGCIGDFRDKVYNVHAASALKGAGEKNE